MWRAAFSSLPKRKDSKLVVLTSAGDLGHFSHKVLTNAVAGNTWRVNQVRGPIPWISKADLEEQRGSLPHWEFSRLMLNEWMSADDKLTNLDDVRAAVTLDEPLEPKKGTRYVVSVDVGLVRDRTVVSVCHMDGETVVLDRQQTWQGSRDNPVKLETVEAFIYEASTKYNRAPVIADPWQAAQLCQNLRTKKIKVSEFTFSASSVGRLAVTLHRLLRDHRLSIYDDEQLIDELMNVKLLESSPGVYRIDHDAGAHDDRVISLALAAQHLVSQPKAKPTRLGAVDLSAGLGKGGHSRGGYTHRKVGNR